MQPIFSLLCIFNQLKLLNQLVLNESVIFHLLTRVWTLMISILSSLDIVLYPFAVFIKFNYLVLQIR